MKGNVSNWSYLEDYGVIWRIMEKKRRKRRKRGKYIVSR